MLGLALRACDQEATLLQRTAFHLGIACALAFGGSGLAVVASQPYPHQSAQLGSQEERINRRQVLDTEAQRELRDQGEVNELIGRLVADDTDAETGLAAQRKLQVCQWKRRVSEQGLPPTPADTQRRCTPDIQPWSKVGIEGIRFVSC